MGNRVVKIAVLVSGGGTNLQALLDAEKAGKLTKGKISLVVSNKSDAFAIVRARSVGVDTVVVLKKDYPTQEAFEQQLVKVLKDNGIGLVVLAGFMSILGTTFISAFEDRIINVHPSLIPSFCGKGFYGLKVHEAALAYGVKITGATVHFVNEIPDGGKIIMQRAVKIRKTDTPESLQKLVMKTAEWKILPKATELVCSQILKNEK